MSNTHKKVLENNLRLIVHSMPGSKSCNTLVLVGAGSRYETLEQNGIAHFLEHMFFKGAKHYKNTKEVSEAIDGVGGEFNAFTAKEYAGYYVKVAKQHVETSMNVLSDMMLNATFEKEEIEKERGVILEEYNMYQDTPMYQASWDFEKHLFGDHPMGRDQIGTKELIKSVTQEQFFDFQKKLYTPDNTVICLVGDFESEEGFQLLEKYFQFPNTKKQLEFEPLKLEKNKPEIHVINKKTEQAHLVLGFPSISNKDPKKWAAKVLATALGGNMSSRMFLNIREAKGLCYYIHTDCDLFSDCGSFSTRAGVDTTRAQDAITAIENEYIKARKDGITQKELDKSKAYLLGKMLLRMEDSEYQAHFLAHQELIQNELKSADQIKEIIDNITLDQVNTLAKELLDPNKLHLTIIGPYKEDQFTFTN